jgi:hypothetical protein
MRDLIDAVTDADELRHEPSAEPTWRENWWLCFFDHETGVRGVAYTGVQPGLSTGFAMFAIFRGREALTVLDEKSIPLDKNGHRENGAGPIRFDCVEPMRQWRVTVSAPSAQADLSFSALHPAYDWDWDGATRSRHYEQPGRVEGSIVVGDTRLEVHGLGQRDRAWGVREPSLLRQAWSSRVLLTERDLCHASAITVGDRTFLFGYRITDGRSVLIDRLQLDISYAYPGGPPLSTELAASSEGNLVMDHQVRLENLIPHATISGGRETRQFFTFSEFADGGLRRIGQLDHWWSDRSALRDQIDVSGNQGRWVR